MSLVTISVDGKHMKVEEGALLIDALIDNDIDLPYFCYHQAVGADGNCRMCMVEIEGQKRPQIACDTFVKDGMEIRIDSPKVNKVRKDILELELINHPVDCPICDQAGECSLQEFYMDYGLYEHHIEKKEKLNKGKKVDLGRNVVLDQERCVLCTRCVRFTKNITKTHELGVVKRGDHSCISTMPGRKLTNEYAMNVVDLCPVGALTSQDFRFAQRVWFLKPTESICHGCNTGCNIYIDHNKEKYKEDTIYRFRPRVNNEINGHFICDDGRLSYKGLSDNRQLIVQKENKEVSKEEGLTSFNRLVNNAQKIVILVDPNLYLEDFAIITIFAKQVGAKVVSPLASYYDEAFGDDWLKSPWRCANKEGLQGFDIPEEIEDDTNIDLLINFNHKDFNKFKATQSVSFQTHQEYKSDLIIPIPVFSEYSGTVMNKDRIKQHCEQAIIREESIESIAYWLQAFKGSKS